MKEAGKRVAFLDNTYEEAIALTREAREYLTFQEPADRAQLTPEARLVTACEIMRLTARLTQVVSWLLVHKAVNAGEMNRASAGDPRFRLSGHKICAEEDPMAGEFLPPRLGQLMEDSHALYARVARLDAMLEPRNEAR